MATEHSASSTLPWIWVIEALASFKEVNASLLIELVKKTPDISDDMGKNAREVVSFRILESLFAKALGTSTNVASLPDSKVGFESSERCEDVLRVILDESSGSKLKLSEVEMSKYDIEPFITHKRSCLPKSDLEQIKDLILQGNHPLLAPLKEKSGLAFSNEPEIVNPNDNGNSNGIEIERLERYNSESQAIAAIRDLIFLSSGNGDIHLQRKSPCKHLLPAKRGRFSSGIGSTERQSNGNHVVVANGCGPHLNHKCDVIASQRLVSPQRIELVEAQSPHRGKEESLLAKEPQLEPNDNRQRIHCNGDEENSKNVSLDKDKEDDIVPQVNGDEDTCEHNEFIPNTFDEQKADLANNVEPKISSDSDDGYNDERTNIATKKHVFLSSECTYSQDLTTDIIHCMKCNGSGPLLVCSSNACPLVVHENCLGSAPTFDEQGNFYCPFCAYSRAISEYLDLKKKASLAKKDLTAFIGSGDENQPKKVSKKMNRSKKKRPRKDADLDENVNGDENPSSSMENVHQKEPLAPGESVNPPSGEKGTDINKGKTVKIERKKNGGDFIPPRGLVEEEDDPAQDKGEVDKSSDHVGPLSTDVEGSSEEENDTCSASNYSIRFRKREKQHTNPSIPQLRRKKLAWTKVEEDTLKEGIQRFSNANDKNIPWKKILEFGSDVFIVKGRTAMDLKDKWRNLCKGSPRSAK